MGLDASTMNRITRTAKDPWSCVVGRRSKVLRGAASWRLRDYERALADQEHGIGMLENVASSDYITIQALVNIVSIKVSMGHVDEALKRIESMQACLKGEDSQGVERTRLILRWLRALVLEITGEMKCAGQILDRIEARLRAYDMRAELKVLLADRARMASSESLVKRIVGSTASAEMTTKKSRMIDSPPDYSSSLARFASSERSPFSRVTWA